MLRFLASLDVRVNGLTRFVWMSQESSCVVACNL